MDKEITKLKNDKYNLSRFLKKNYNQRNYANNSNKQLDEYCVETHVNDKEPQSNFYKNINNEIQLLLSSNEYNEFLEKITNNYISEIKIYKETLDEVDRQLNFIDNCGLSQEEINEIIKNNLTGNDKIEYMNAYNYLPKDAIKRYKLNPEVIKKIYEKTNYGPKDIEEYNNLKEQRQLCEIAISKKEKLLKTVKYDNLIYLKEFQNYQSITPTKEQIKDIINLIGPEYMEDESKIEISYKEYCKKYGNMSPAEFYKTCKEYYPNCVVIDITNKMDLSLLKEASENNSNLLKIYNYIYEKEGLDAANKYLEDYKDTLNQIIGKQRAEKFLNTLEKDENGNYKQASLNQLSVTLKGLTDGIENFGNGISAWTEGKDSFTIDEYETMYFLKAIQNDELLLNALEINYNISQSVGNMAPSMALSVITANPTIGLTSLGVSSGGRNYHNALVEGYSVDQAVIYGIVSGSNEAVLEKFLGSIPGLSDSKVNSIKTWLKAAGQEGVEEFAQTWTDSVARSILLSEEQNYSDVLNESIESAAYGIATGGFLNSFNLISEYSSQNSSSYNEGSEEITINIDENAIISNLEDFSINEGDYNAILKSVNSVPIETIDMGKFSNWANYYFANIYGSDTIQRIINEINIVTSEEEWNNLCKQQNIDPLYTDGFVDRNHKTYIKGKNGKTHAVVHEFFHRLSEERNKNNKFYFYNEYGQLENRKITGIREYKTTESNVISYNTNLTNETLTEYLTAKYYDKAIYASQYGKEYIEMWNRIDDAIKSVYGKKGENFLLMCYLNNDTNSLRIFFDKYGNKGDYDKFTQLIENKWKGTKELETLVENIEFNVYKNNHPVMGSIKSIFRR